MQRSPSRPGNSRLAAALYVIGQSPLPGGSQLGNCDLEDSGDLEIRSADTPDHRPAVERLDRAGDHEPLSGRLPEQLESLLQLDRRADVAGDAAFRHRYGDTTLGDVMGAVQHAGPNR